MIRSENNLKMHVQWYFQNEAYIQQLFIISSHIQNARSV